MRTHGGTLASAGCGPAWPRWGNYLSHKRVWRLMKAAGLRGRHPKAWKRTTIGGDKPVPAPDLIGRAFFADRPNEKWCGSGSRGRLSPRLPRIPA